MKKAPKINPAFELRANKRLKTLSGIGLSTNQRMLAKTLDTLRAMPAEDREEVIGSDRHALQEATNSLWAEVGCSIQLEVEPGKFDKWECTSFAKTITSMIRRSGSFKEKLLELWRSKPCTKSNPYNLLIYGDELVPGNVLHLDTTRKLFGCQCCIKDFGPQHIHANYNWIPLFCIRHNVASWIPGGMSYVLRMYLRHMMLVEKINDRGVVVPLDTEAAKHVVLYFKVSNLICDGDALRMLTNWKGAKAKLPCFRCLNVLGVTDEEEVPEGFLTLRSRDTSSFAAATNADWWEKADTLSLQQPLLNKREFAKLEVASGLNFNEKGILWDKELRRHFPPMDVCTYDFMHTMLSDGVAHDEIALILERLKSLGDDWSPIHAIMRADWRHSRKNMRSTFSPKREALFHKTGVFHADASEMLAILPVFGHYLETVAKVKHGDALQDAIHSFHALACCVALCKEGKEGTQGGLMEAMLKHGAAKSIAYPRSRCRAKDHWRLHIGDQMARDGFVIDCFAGERVNRHFKKCAAEVPNAGNDLRFEATVTKRTMVHFIDLLEYNYGDQLRRPIVRSPDLAAAYGGDCFVACSLVVHGLTLSKGDIVHIDDTPYLLQGGASVNGALALVVVDLVFVGQETMTSTRWRRRDNGAGAIAKASEHRLRTPANWYLDGDTFVILTI